MMVRGQPLIASRVAGGIFIWALLGYGILSLGAFKVSHCSSAAQEFPDLALGCCSEHMFKHYFCCYRDWADRALG